MPQPLWRPKTTQNCDSHSLSATKYFNLNVLFSSLKKLPNLKWNVLVSSIPIDWPTKKFSTPHLDALNKKPDVAAALAKHYGFDEGKVKVRSIRPGYSESQIAVISLPLNFKNKGIKGVEVQIGWTIWRIRERGGEGDKATQCSKKPECFICAELWAERNPQAGTKKSPQRTSGAGPQLCHATD